CASESGSPDAAISGRHHADSPHEAQVTVAECWSLPTFSSAGHRRFGRNGGQNPKSEIRNPKQIPMSKGASTQNQAAAGGLIGSGFEDLSFEFGACFGFRVSDFGFVLAGHRCAARKMV